MKKTTIAATAAALLLALATLPASAGLTGTLDIAPDVTEQGGTVVIGNSANNQSTCLPAPVPSSEKGAAADGDPQIALEIADPTDELLVGTRITPDVDGNWSFETEALETVGVYQVFATCQFEGVSPDAVPAASPVFSYAVGTFEVIAQQATTTVAPTTVAPTTTTTAGTSAITATPKYTG